MSAVVALEGAQSAVLADVEAGAQSASGTADALALAGRWGAVAPLPAGGRTGQLWSILATLGAVDLSIARTVEPHLDAIAILAEAGRPRPGGTWGVYAAERSGTIVTASPDGAAGVVLSGRKPWCSLADRLDHALITAHEGDERRLYAVDLHDEGVRPVADEWHALGLAAVPSGALDLDGVPAEPIGEPGWYLTRPGFAWGGIGVAACWFGGATAVARAMLSSSRTRPPDQLAEAAIGRVDRALHTARLALETAAAAIDSRAVIGSAGATLAARTRGIVAAAAEDVLLVVGHALGPAPLTLDREHARRVADLTVYLRQHHAERDDAALGRTLLAADSPW